MFLTYDTPADDVVVILPLSDLPKRRDITFTEPAEVRIGRYVDQSGLHLSIHSRVSVKFSCYRCSRPATRSYESVFEETFPEGDDYLDWSLRDGVDVKEPVFEAVYHTVPDVLLCHDDCLGLCPVCGCDKNTTGCDCNVSATDNSDDENPFAVLMKKFRD